MRLWPFEKRESGNYSDTLINAILSRAQGSTLAIPSASAALEMCAGVVGRSFASAEASGRPGVVEALTPDCLEMVGRGLVRHGEVVFLIDTTAGLKLLPAQSWDVDGGPAPDSWTASPWAGLAGPSHMITYPRPASCTSGMRLTPLGPGVEILRWMSLR